MPTNTQREYQVTVITASGDYSVTVWPNQHIQAVLGEVLARMGVTRNLDEYELVWNQQRLPRDELVRSAGVHEGDELFLESNPAGGI